MAGRMTTIKSSREIDRIFREAKRAAHPLIILLTAPTPTGRGLTGRVAFIAGKKLGSAVWRNRSRRVLREGVRRAGGPWAGRDAVLIARTGLDRAAPREIDAAIESLLKRSGLR
jgi:ribonuclease P protein component